MNQLDLSRPYRRILILESRDWWQKCSEEFDAANDLVLTYDLALRRKVERMGGQALYLDHLVESKLMQQYNFDTYRFFRKWHLDADGKDIFTHRDIPFGFAFRIEIWNDLLSYVLNRANLERLREIKFEQLQVGTDSGLVESLLTEMGFAYTNIKKTKEDGDHTYYFPIHRWMAEKVRSRKLKHRIMRWFIACQGITASWLDRVVTSTQRPSRIFFQFYHPTRKIFHELNHNPKIKLIVGHFTPSPAKSKYFTERPIPIWGSTSRFAREGLRLMDEFQRKRHARLVLNNNLEISESIYSIIQQRLEGRITEYLRDLDCVINYLNRYPVHLEVMIANIGKIDTLVDCVCKQRGIPSYLIINGLLGPEYLDESKYASVINAYSDCIKADYFCGMDNIVCLGDPRMDDYSVAPTKSLNRECPVVTIGASGFNVVDLNSYTAIEFEFMWDVLLALQNVRQQGVELRIIIKVRPNGYREQYEAFVAEYFPGLVDEIHDTMPMRCVLERSDLYISIYSQTLFEASCLGIPSIYYKKDTEILSAPFDGKSELVTVASVLELERAISDFRSGHNRFDPFLQKSVMEKYIGPLDGGNVKRNLDYIYHLLQQQGSKV